MIRRPGRGGAALAPVLIAALALAAGPLAAGAQEIQGGQDFQGWQERLGGRDVQSGSERGAREFGRRAVGRGLPSAPGDFDFYVLALSWSPAYCEREESRRGGREDGQCARGAGLGFVLHGLWPQDRRGYPAGCRPDAPGPSRAAMEVAREAYPSEGLARHEWRKHGTCSGLDPRAYFEAAREARARVAVPELPARLGPVEVERAFAAVNPGLRPDMLAVSCARGALSEVRVCLAKDLRGFTPCGEVDRAGCRAREVRVPPPA